MTDLAAIKAELRVLLAAADIQRPITPSDVLHAASARFIDLIVAAVNALPALLADTPSVEPASTVPFADRIVCGAVTPDGRFACARRRNHEGQHTDADNLDDDEWLSLTPSVEPSEAPERTQAGAELAAYLWGVLITVGSERRERINQVVRGYIRRIEDEAGLRPSVEPAGVGVELLIDAIRSATRDAIRDTLNQPTAEHQARDMATRIATKYAKGLERLREKIKALPRSRRSGIGWDAIDRDKVLALLPPEASDSPEKP